MSGIGQTLGVDGAQVGGQAQFGTYLTLFTRLLTATEDMALGPVYGVTPWTGGNLVIATQFPNLKRGLISLKPTVPGPIVVTLPGTGGPWLVADGSGFCSGGNTITVQNAAGTVRGAASVVMNTAWANHQFILDGTNYLQFG